MKGGLEMDILESIFKRIEFIVSSQESDDDKDSRSSFVRWCAISELLLVLFSADFDKVRVRYRLLRLAEKMPFPLQKKRLLLLAGEPREKVFCSG